MDILNSTNQQVIDYIDNLPGGLRGTVIDDVLRESTVEQHNILVKAILSGFDKDGYKITK